MMRGCSFVFLVLVLFCLTACDQDEIKKPTHSEIVERKITPIHISPDSYQKLSRIFSNYEYKRETVQQRGAPPFILDAFPSNLNKVKSVQEKKDLFFLSLLPMAILANESILEEQRKMEALFKKKDQGKTLTKAETRFIVQLIRKYKINGELPLDDKQRHVLRKRVDTIPAELVLAQAAYESAWGTSRFARVGNNLFGEWTYTPGSGIVPKNRPEGARHEVAKFDTLYDSLLSYVQNLNTNRAYQSLRNLRVAQRHRGHQPDGYTLAAGLTLYSSRGEDYVRGLRALMRQNGLAKLGDVKLR